MSVGAIYLTVLTFIIGIIPGPEYLNPPLVNEQGVKMTVSMPTAGQTVRGAVTYPQDARLVGTMDVQNARKYSQPTKITQDLTAQNGSIKIVLSRKFVWL